MSSLKISVCFFLTLCTNLLYSQVDYWTPILDKTNIDQVLTRNLDHYDLYNLKIEDFISQVPSKNAAPSQISLPSAEGKMLNFQIWDAPIMQKGLADKYSHIRTFLIENMEDPNMHGRLSITSAGMRAYITSCEEPYFIYPTGKSAETYAVFKKSERIPMGGFRCEFNEEPVKNAPQIGERSFSQIGDELRTYRLAVSTTGEYSSYHGGNRTTVMEAIVEAVNQVNVVYENDFAVRFILVENNDLLINLNADKDPFDNTDAGQMLSTNPSVINSRIGANSYDLGHVFATGGAGLASLRSSCRNDKAQGTTGIFPPEGNPFSIDYVAHEFGHQLGSNHTFNNCGGNESANFAYEPGSGSTIMAYAGLCGANNVQFSSDDYFHVSSLIQISNWLNGNGGSCAETTDTNNNTPSVEAGTGGFFIPIETPFRLTAEASDPDGDELTYCWEQYNTGPRSAYGEPEGDAPSFRSFRPTINATRYFPKLNVVISGNENSSEVLPSSSRALDFQCTVRDNKAGGGGLAWDDISFRASEEAGPFVVTSQSETGIVWETNRLATVTWDVANTDQAPVNCQKVDIILSKTLGNTFDIVLAENVDNNGSHTFFVPDGAETNFAYVMVAAADNVFYQVNDRQFKVIEGIASAVDESFQNSINVFPNPSNGKFIVNMEDISNAQVELVDLQGKTLQTLEINNSRQELQIDAPAGLYFLKITQGVKLGYKRIVISK